MYRSLIIGLGESLRPVCQYLDGALERDVVTDEERDVQVSTLRLFRRSGDPEEGGSFEETLREQALGELTDLLGMTAQTSSRPWLDIFVLFDLSEEGPRSVLKSSIEELTALVRDNFEAIFPSFQRGGDRQVRIIPISIIGTHNADERDPILADVREIERWIADRHDPEQYDEDCLVDRFFVLDGVTPQGLVPKDDLLAQTANFLELTILGGRRRRDPFASLLEYGGTEIGATFSTALWRLDALDLHARLTHCLKEGIVDTLLEGGASSDFGIELEDHLLEDDTLFEEYLDRIERLPEETFRNQGPAAVVDLAGRYGRLLDETQKRKSNLDNERAGLQDQLADDAEESGTDASSSTSGGGVLGSALGGLALGGVVFALAVFALGAVVAGAVISGGIAIVGALVLYWLLSGTSDSSTSSSTRRESSAEERRLEAVEAQLERLETLRQSLRDAYTSMHALEEALKALEPGTLEASGSVDELDLDLNLPVRRTFVSNELEQALFETSLPYTEVETAAHAFAREHVKPLEEWASGDRLDSERLETFASEAFEDIKSADLFEAEAVREAVESSFRDFLESWQEGLPLFLDLRSRRQYDPDGFLSPFDQTLVVPAHLENFARELVGDLGVPFDVESGLRQGDRAYLIHTVVDIHPRAMPKPSDDFEGGDGSGRAGKTSSTSSDSSDGSNDAGSTSEDTSSIDEEEKPSSDEPQATAASP